MLESVAGSAPAFRVKQVSPRFQQWLANVPPPLAGTFLEQLPAPFNEPYLIQQLQATLSSGADTQFQLPSRASSTGNRSVYTCQVVRADKETLVLSVETAHQRADEPTLPDQVLETLPTGLVIFRALRDEQDTIIDFQATFCNELGAQISRQDRNDILNRPISQRYRDIQAFELFDQYKAVVTTGKPHKQLLYLSKQDVWLDVSIVRFADGLMVAFQDVTLGQKTASLLESILQSSPAAIRYYESIRDDSGQIVDFLISTGNELDAYRPYRPHQFLTGKRLLDLYPDLIPTGTFERYRQVVETGCSDHFELPYTVGGQLVWFDCTTVRHGDGFVMTTLDISIRKRAQLDLQNQAHLLQTVLDNSLTGVARLRSVLDAQGNIVDFIFEKINVTLAHTLRQSTQAIEGQPLSVIMPHQMTNGLFDRYVVVAQSQQTQRFEWSNQDGSVWYDISAVAFNDGLIVTFLDITTIKLAQLNIEQQKELMAGILDTSPNSVLFLEAVAGPQGQPNDFRISLVNPAALRMLPRLMGKEFTSENLLTHTLLEFLPAETAQEIIAVLTTIMQARHPVQQQTDYPDRGLTYAYDITPFRNGLLLIASDITPLRAYQKKLEENNEALSRSNEHLQQFAYVASHDLQEPLRKIQAFGSLIQSQYGSQLGEGAHYLDRMQGAASRMSVLIRDLLTFSRISTHQEAAKAVPLIPLIESVLTDLDLIIQETEARITVDSLPIIQGDPTQLGQLFQNLLSNALKFRRPDVSPLIRISCHTLAATKLPPSVKPARTAAQYYRIDVTDNGIGFDEKFLDRIFQVFQRLHGRSEFAGTGVGLAICEKVVANHGGAITAHSQPNHGATFSVFLPVEG